VQNVDDEFTQRGTFERSVMSAELVQDTATRPHVACSTVTNQKHM